MLAGYAKGSDQVLSLAWLLVSAWLDFNLGDGTVHAGRTSCQMRQEALWGLLQCCSGLSLREVKRKLEAAGFNAISIGNQTVLRMRARRAPTASAGANCFTMNSRSLIRSSSLSSLKKTRLCSLLTVSRCSIKAVIVDR